MLLKDFKHDVKTVSISDMSLLFSDNQLAIATHEKLIQLGDNNLLTKLSDYNLFSKHTSFKTRSLIGLCLGSDVFRGGCQGVGASKLNDAMIDAGNNDTEIN